MAEPRRARSIPLASSDVLARVTVALNCDSRFLRLPFSLVWELSSEKKLRASRFRPGEGGTRLMEGAAWDLKSCAGKSKDSMKRVFSGVGLARLVLICPGASNVNGSWRHFFPSGVDRKISFEVLSL